MTTEEAKEVLGDVRAYLACRAILENEILAGHTFTDICNAIKTLEQEPFINKPCISKGVCHEDKNKILDKISAEIENQEKWLLEAGYNAYNLDIAFNTIKSALIESKECGIQIVKQVEMSKIDKALSEIVKLITESVRVNPWGKDYRKGLMKAMAIIERNVGE